MAIITNEILIPKKLFSSNVEKDLELDSPLPEYCPDIARIIKAECTPFAESCTVADGKATVCGKAVYDILYETDYKSRLRCASFTQDFSCSVPIPRTNAVNITAACRVKCERIGCKLLSPRRAIIKATIGTLFDIEGESAVKAVAATEDKEAFFRKRTVRFDGKASIAEGDYRFGDLLPLAQSEKSIGEIVCGSVTLQAPQLQLTPGKAEIKTTASVCTLCEEENNEGHYFTSVKSLPVSIEYTNDALTAPNAIELSLTPYGCEFTPELDQYGESRVVKAAFSVKLRMKIGETKEYTVADDMFEKDFDSVPSLASVTFRSLHARSEAGFSTDAKLAAFSPKPEYLLDSSVRVYSSEATRNEDGVLASGSFIVTLLVATAEGVHSFDSVIPYNQLLNPELPEGEADISCETIPSEVIATLHSDGSATVRVIASTAVQVYTETEESFISEVSKRIARERRNEDDMLIYCFPTDGEDLWSIAKLYRVPPESITEANPALFDDDGRIADIERAILIKP